MVKTTKHLEQRGVSRPFSFPFNDYKPKEKGHDKKGQKTRKYTWKIQKNRKNWLKRNKKGHTKFQLFFEVMTNDYDC